jgi:hypothetical protein
MKKLSSILVLALVVTLCLSSTCIAETNSFSKSDLSTEEKVQNLLDEGLNLTDAQYYAALDDVVKNMEKSGEEFTLEESVSLLSDEEVAKDINAYRARILNGDPAAIKKALDSQIYSQGIDDLQALIEQNNGYQKYEIQYPDGSKIAYEGHISLIQGSDDILLPSAYSEAYYQGGQLSSSATYAKTTEWKFISGASYSSLAVYSVFALNRSTGTANITNATGGQSSYGVISIANASAGIDRAYNDQNIQQPAQASNQVVFQVSGSFGAAYAGLSISVNAGASWTQYAIYRIYGDGIWGDYAGKYI